MFPDRYSDLVLHNLCATHELNAHYILYKTVDRTKLSFLFFCINRPFGFVENDKMRSGRLALEHCKLYICNGSDCGGGCGGGVGSVGGGNSGGVMVQKPSKRFIKV